MIRRWLAGALMPAVICLALTPNAAHAEKLVKRDARGDVLLLDDTQTLTPQPAVKGIDVVKSVVKHTRKKVAVKVKMRDLGRLGATEFAELSAVMETDRKPHSAFVFKGGSGPTGFELVRGKKTIKCRGAKKKFSAAKDVVRMSLPRSCVGNPRWIRVTVAVFATNTDFPNEILVEDGLRQGINRKGTLRISPKLRRG
jgi:hypothetical protein